jgi:hypothetical protein
MFILPVEHSCLCRQRAPVLHGNTGARQRQRWCAPLPWKPKSFEKRFAQKQYQIPISNMFENQILFIVATVCSANGIFQWGNDAHHPYRCVQSIGYAVRNWRTPTLPCGNGARQRAQLHTLRHLSIMLQMFVSANFNINTNRDQCIC